MIKMIPAEARHFNDFGWLKTYWLFSFANYFDPENIQLGALRVFNDDIVEPGSGFPTHPHQEMEIITVVLEGEITHKDSMGNTSIIRAGDVQRMSAGTGLTHSEFNLSDKPVHLYQIWLYPDRAGLKPSYEQKRIVGDTGANFLIPLASGQEKPGAVVFHTDATIYRGKMERGGNLEFRAGENRRLFVYVTEGRLHINGRTLEKSGQARIDLEIRLELKTDTGAEFILIDVPSCRGWGYNGETLRGAKAK